MRPTTLVIIALAACAAASCSPPAQTPPPASSAPAPAKTAERRYLLERVDDAAVVQIYADDFASLDLKTKTLVWHLYQAAIAGRDIYYDQRSPAGLEMRD